MHKPVERFFQPFKDFNQGRKIIHARLKSKNFAAKAASETTHFGIGVLIAEAGAIGGMLVGLVAGMGFDAITQALIPIYQSNPAELAIIAPFAVAGLATGMRQAIELTPQAIIGKGYRRRIQ